MISVIFCLFLAGAAGSTLELRGRIEPAPRSAVVAIYGAYSPFTASAVAGSDGKFRFKNLDPGTYTVSVLSPGQGEVRQTVEVTPGRASRKGVVEARIAFHPSPATAGEGAGVSVRQLSIPKAAVREYEEAQSLLSRRDVDGAVQHLQRAVELAPAYAEAWNHLGTIAYQRAQYAQAETCFRKALEASPHSYSPMVNLGGVLINLGRPAEALQINLRAVRERPEDALAHSQLGLCYFLTGNDESALRHLKLAKALDPAHFSRPQLTLARIYARRGDRENAAAELADFLKRHPDAPEAPQIRAQYELLKGDNPNGNHGEEGRAVENRSR